MGVGRRGTTAEAVAYERARPLKRPGERGSGGGSRRELGVRGLEARPAAAGKLREKEEKKKRLVGRSGGAEPPPATFVRPRLGAKKGAS